MAPLHGRYHSLAAEHVSARLENDGIIVQGTVRETALFGHVLEVNRTIRIPAFGSSVTVEDTVTNLTPRDEEIMQIYHCNFGYPMLSEKAHLYLWDEPLNYIDVFSRMQLEELLVRQPMTMVFIEHDDAFVQRVAQTVITW